MYDTRRQVRFWVEIDTAPIDNFAVPIDVAVGQVLRTLDDDSLVTAVDVAATPDRELAIRVQVEADNALEGLNHAVEGVHKAARRHRLGVLELTGVRSIPEHEAQRGITQRQHGGPRDLVNPATAHSAAASSRPAEPEVAAAPSDAARPLGHVAAPSHEVWRGTGTPADPAIGAFGQAARLAEELRGLGSDDVARSIERWLRPGLGRTAAIRGLRHQLLTIKDMSMHLWGMSTEHHVEAVIAALTAAR